MITLKLPDLALFIILPLLVINAIAALINLIPVKNWDVMGPHPYIGALFALNVIVTLILLVCNHNKD